MVPSRRGHGAAATRFPHGRGDGPRYMVTVPVRSGFSPRTWGWSVQSVDERRPVSVFPTDVGMVRFPAAWRASRDSFPHGRGDGPVNVQPSFRKLQFSPRTWGWSEDETVAVTHVDVFPTDVGMVRRPGTPSSRSSRFPHGRGDGPAALTGNSGSPRFSPRTWGWSATSPPIASTTPVFPTDVGMVRLARTSSVPCRSFPHGRGDGPDSGRASSRRPRFSPRTWGWSGVAGRGADHSLVFPTDVGMVREAEEMKGLYRSFPHGRGDGPAKGTCRRGSDQFSPRTWGWSAPE